MSDSGENDAKRERDLTSSLSEYEILETSPSHNDKPATKTFVAHRGDYGDVSTAEINNKKCNVVYTSTPPSRPPPNPKVLKRFAVEGPLAQNQITKIK